MKINYSLNFQSAYDANTFSGTLWRDATKNVKTQPRKVISMLFIFKFFDHPPKTL